MIGSHRRTGTLTAEPTGNVYRALLEYAASLQGSFSLVWRSRRVSYDERFTSLLVADRIAAVTTSAWPGTRLLDETAVLRTYRWTRNSTDVLLGAPGLYAWGEESRRPEDLALYDAEGTPWLATVGQARRATVSFDVVDRFELLQAVPGLLVRLSYPPQPRAPQ